MSPRLLSASVVLFGALNLPFCAHLDTGAVRDGFREGGKAMASSVKEEAETAAKNKAKCDELAKKDIVFEEERAIGGAVAVALANQAAHRLMIDPAVGDVKVLQKEPPTSVKAPPGAKRDLNAYVATVGKNLAAFSTRPTLNWTFAVLDDPAANAFSAPGGYVFITRGLLQKLDNEAQLAGVLAHEISHVTQKHALNHYRDSKVSSCKLAIAGEFAVGVLKAGATGAAAGVAAGGNSNLKETFSKLLDSASGFLDLDNLSGEAIAKIADAAVETIQKGNSKEDEFAADSAAVKLVVAAGYNPDEYGNLIRKTPESSGLFANHPKNADRLKNIKTTLDELAPSPDTFGYADAKKNPVVSFKDELKAAK